MTDLPPPWPAETDRLVELPYAVVDVETTGHSPIGDRITEIAIVHVREGKPVDSWSSLVNPGIPISSFITNLTGISDHTVRDAPPFEAISEEVSRRLRGSVMVAHNAAFDHAFVSVALNRANGALHPIPSLCTVRLARLMLPELSRRNLDTVSAWYGFDNEARHRAMGDAQVTSKILLKLLDAVYDEGVDDWGTLQERLKRSRRTSSSRSPSPIDPWTRRPHKRTW